MLREEFKLPKLGDESKHPHALLWDEFKHPNALNEGKGSNECPVCSLYSEEMIIQKRSTEGPSPPPRRCSGRSLNFQRSGKS